MIFFCMQKLFGFGKHLEVSKMELQQPDVQVNKVEDMVNKAEDIIFYSESRWQYCAMYRHHNSRFTKKKLSL